MTTKYTKRFDFDVGHLVKSPCKNCRDYGLFPRCITGCIWLDEIHDVLSMVVSNTR